MTLTVRPVDPAGPDLVPWYRVWRQAHEHDLSDDPPWLLPEIRGRALARDDERSALLLAEDGATPVGALFCLLPLADNRHVLLLDTLAVVPERRRAGIGTTLLRHAEQVAADGDRSTLIAEVAVPGADDHDVPGDLAARAWGFTRVSTEQRRDLVLPLAPQVPAQVWRRVGGHLGYRIVAWAGATPEEYLADRALIQQRMSTDAPLGGLDWQEERWDAERMRRFERSVQDMGRLFWTAGAVEERTGRLVAATWLQVHPDQPHQVWQWDTLVLPEHRGHRLGLAVKMANLEQLGEQWPAARRVSTGNAPENTAMVAVNDALGFSVTGYWREYQRHRV